MNIEIRLPNINAPTSEGKLQQIQSYMHQLVQQLNWALNTVETAQRGNASPSVVVGKDVAPQDAESTFNSIKALIIKSADIVSAYYDTIDQLLATSGQYVAQSDFGTYSEEVRQQLSAQTDQITQNITRTEQIGDQLRTQDSYLRYGAVGTTLGEADLAAENAAGIEIGDFQSINGAGNQRYARFTAYGLELFGSDKSRPIAYISGNRLYITNAEIRGNLKLGGYQVSTENGLTFNWVGGGSYG